MSTDLLIEMHTKIIEDRAYYKQRAAHLETAAAAHEQFRSALHEILRTETPMTDEQLLAQINAEVRIARASDRPATATMDGEIGAGWPGTETVEAAEQTIVVGDPASSAPNMPGITGRRWRIGELLGDPNDNDNSAPSHVVTPAGVVWALAGLSETRADYRNEAGEILPFPDLVALYGVLYEVQPAEQLAHTNGATQ